MRPPGSRLRSLAQRFCDPSTRERLIDPVLADLRHEYAGAVRQGCRWRSRWIHLAGCIAFWKVSAIVLGRASTRELSTADGGSVGRTIRFAGIATTLMTALLMWPPLSHVTSISGAWNTVRLFIYLMPQALAIALPMGLAFGVLCGLSGRVPAARSRMIIIVLAAASSLAALVVVGWLLPEANQAFRELTYQQMFGTAYRVAIRRGLNELTLGELMSTDTYKFHSRLALACAPLTLGVFSLALATVTHRTRALTAGVAALAICFAYYLLLYTSRQLSLGRDELAYSYHLAGTLAAWTPNLVFGAAALLLHLRTRGRPGAAPSRRDAVRQSADRSADLPT